MNRVPEVISSQTLLRGPIFDVALETLRLPSGRLQSLHIVRHPGAVAIAPVCAGGELLLVRQYRHAAREWLVEIPAGRLEAGEEPLAAAQRELEEETGHRASQWEILTRFLPAPGFCSESMTLFMARELEGVSEDALAPDPDEEFELLRLRPEEILQSAEVRDAKTLLAAALLHLRR